jgi:serine/threonine protein phosphatase 1
MGRVLAVGDIHGCAAELDHLAPTAADELVFLGDYIDRGPDSRAVVERLIGLRRAGLACVFLRGNHEDMLLAYMKRGGLHGDAFVDNGGSATLRSYGLAERSGPELARRLPEGHLEFYLSLRLRHQRGDHLFVHAGIRPGRPLDAQTDEDLVWIREDFTHHTHSLGCTVVHGHTPYREVVVRLPFRIGIDTGVVYGNKLSCLDVTGGTLHQVRRDARRAETRPLDDLIAADI